MSVLPATLRSSLASPARLWGSRPWVGRALLWVVLCTVVTTALGFGWWTIESPARRTPDSAKLVIAPGTAQSIASGSAVYLPSAVSLRPGGRLLVVNEDSASHTINQSVIPPGATAEIIAPGDASAFTCTIHPSGRLGLTAAARPPLWLGLLVGAVPGLVMGSLGAGIAELTRGFEPS